VILSAVFLFFGLELRCDHFLLVLLLLLPLRWAPLLLKGFPDPTAGTSLQG